MAPRFHDLTLVDAAQEGEDGICLTLDVPPALAQVFAFAPGQYLTLRAGIGGEDMRRPYSICSAPGQPLQVGIKRVEGGRFSTHACALKAGDRIAAMAPDGRFTATPGHADRVLLIAAGSGITPMLSIAQALLEGHARAEVTVLYGNRTTPSVMFRERLADLKDRFLGRCRVIHVLSREAQDVDLLHGRIDAERLRAMIKAGMIAPREMDGIYLCGPGTMIDTLEMELTMTGVERTRIHAERFVPADGGVVREAPSAPEQVKGAIIETILDGQRRVFEHVDQTRPVLAAAQAAGIDLPFSCAGGMCCTCRCRLVEGTAEMMVNYSLESWEIDAGFTLACQARPTSDRLVLDFDAV